MNFIFFWINFVLLMSFAGELDQKHFLLSSGALLCFTYFYNRVTPQFLSLKFVLLVFNIPVFLLWYITFVYNDFLCFSPVSCEVFMGLLFTYIGAALYLFKSSSTFLNLKNFFN